MSKLRILHFTLAGALLALLLWKADLREVGSVLSDIDPALVAAVVVLNAVVVLLFALRSHLALERLGHRVAPAVLLPVAILGNVAGSLTPASSGEILRAAVMRSHAEIPIEDGLALVVYERALSLYLMALGTGVMVALASLSAPLAAGVVIAAVPLLGLPVIAGGLLGFLHEPEDNARPGLIGGLVSRIHRVAAQLRWLFADRWLLLTWSTVTTGIFALITLQLWLLTRSVSPGVQLHEAWIAFGVSQLVGIASLLPLGLGASDSSLAAALRHFGVTLQQSTGVAILVRASITLPLGLAAMASYLYLLRTGPRTAETAHASIVSDAK